MTRNTEPEKMHLSSEDEHKGLAPVRRAVQLVYNEIFEDLQWATQTVPTDDQIPSIYVTSFAYILGGWKAMVSTSAANAHYYEVTYNKEKGETYIDRYSKDYNKVVKDDKPESEVKPLPQVHFNHDHRVHMTPAEAEILRRRPPLMG